MEKNGITTPYSSPVPHFNFPPLHWDSLASKRARCGLMGKGGRKGEERRREHLWRRVSYKSPAAASPVLLGLMKGGVTATLNSGQAGPWEGGDG